MPSFSRDSTGGHDRHRGHDPAAHIQARIDRMGRMQERMERIRDGIAERHRQQSWENPPPTGRERILEQARGLFLDRGYVEVSMQQIADASGLRKASIYHHFRDKEQLFGEIVLREMQGMRHTAETLIALGGTLPELLERLAFAQFSRVSGSSARMARDFREHVPESRHEEIHQELERTAAVFRGVFERAAERGEIERLDPKMAANTFFHTVLSWSMNFYDDAEIGSMEPHQLAKTAVDVLLYGIAGPALRDKTDGT